MEGLFNTRNKIKIKDSDDFECVAIDIFEDFLRSFTVENGLIRIVTAEELENLSEWVRYTYTTKGMKLAERMLNRLYAVGKKHFPDDDITIDSYLYRDVTD